MILQTTPRPTPAEIAAARFFPDTEYWIAAIDVLLKTDLEGAANPELTLLGPISPLTSVLPGRTAGTYNVAAGAQADQTATTQRDNKFFVDITLLMTRWPKPNCSAPNNKTYLEGKLGIEAWLARAAQEYYLIRQFSPQQEAAEIIVAATTTDKPGNPVIPCEPYSVPIIVGTSSTPVSLPTARGSQPGTNPPAAPAGVAIFNRGPADIYVVSGGTNSVAKADDPAQQRISAGSGWTSIQKYKPTNRGLAAIVALPPNEYRLLAAPGGAQDGTTSQKQTNVPTFGATFTFLTKGGFHLGPSFTTDHLKGGSNTLLSYTRTETNDVNISITPSNTAALTTVIVGGARFRFLQSAGRGPGFVSGARDVDGAIQRLDAQLLKMQLNTLPRTFP